MGEKMEGRVRKDWILFSWVFTFLLSSLLFPNCLAYIEVSWYSSPPFSD